MKLKNILFVVSDIEKSKRFYEELFGLRVITDFGENVILTEGLVLQQRDVWQDGIKKEVEFGGHDAELYFEENDMDGFLAKIKSSELMVEFLNDPIPDHPWGGRVIRLYDPDRHVIEIGETVNR
jgi:catechol 2,3-dioxygenase-like lactoylglutathione lyase family enzyme